jgi:hypothetical protein
MITGLSCGRILLYPISGIIDREEKEQTITISDLALTLALSQRERGLLGQAL